MSAQLIPGGKPALVDAVGGAGLVALMQMRSGAPLNLTSLALGGAIGAAGSAVGDQMKPFLGNLNTPVFGGSIVSDTLGVAALQVVTGMAPLSVETVFGAAYYAGAMAAAQYASSTLNWF